MTKWRQEYNVDIGDGYHFVSASDWEKWVVPAAVKIIIAGPDEHQCVNITLRLLMRKVRNICPWASRLQINYKRATAIMAQAQRMQEGS